MSNHHSFVSKLLCAVLSVVMMISLIPAAAITANAAEKKDEGWLWPVPDSTYITPGRHFRDGHKGIDISASKTRIVVAAKSGTVKKVYSGCNNHSGFGRHCSPATKCKNPPYRLDKKGNKIYYGYCNNGLGRGVLLYHPDGSCTVYGHMESVRPMR